MYARLRYKQWRIQDIFFIFFFLGGGVWKIISLDIENYWFLIRIFPDLELGLTSPLDPPPDTNLSFLIDTRVSTRTYARTQTHKHLVHTRVLVDGMLRRSPTFSPILSHGACGRRTGKDRTRRDICGFSACSRAHILLYIASARNALLRYLDIIRYMRTARK
jgi:hypothetical protein